MTDNPKPYTYTTAEANKIFTAIKQELDSSEVDTP